VEKASKLSFQLPLHHLLPDLNLKVCFLVSANVRAYLYSDYILLLMEERNSFNLHKLEKSQQDRMQESLDDHRIGSKLSIDWEHYEESPVQVVPESCVL
jgi:hypothetical protein